MPKLKNKKTAQLPPVPTIPMNGNECFHSSGEEIGFNLIEFWQWTGSHLISNTTRGNLAEFIVSKGLGIDSKVRSTWEEYDLITKNGLRIEVKSSSYLQAWGQKRYSRPVFGIAPSRAWKPDVGGRAKKAKRHSDVYIFCLLNHKDQSTIDPLNVSQWTFLILPTSILNKHCPNQKTITLGKIRKLGATEVSYDRLKTIVKKVKGVNRKKRKAKC